MKRLILFLLLLPFISISQNINKHDDNGKKTGIWFGEYQNGNLRYKGQFKNGNPLGLFFYYYESGELKVEKEFFHNGQAASTYFFYKDGSLKS